VIEKITLYAQLPDLQVLRKIISRRLSGAPRMIFQSPQRRSGQARTTFRPGRVTARCKVTHLPPERPAARQIRMFAVLY
jgi:hypothetical protein